MILRWKIVVFQTTVINSSTSNYVPASFTTVVYALSLSAKPQTIPQMHFWRSTTLWPAPTPAPARPRLRPPSALRLRLERRGGEWGCLCTYEESRCSRQCCRRGRRSPDACKTHRFQIKKITIFSINPSSLAQNPPFPAQTASNLSRNPLKSYYDGGCVCAHSSVNLWKSAWKLPRLSSEQSHQKAVIS